MLRRGRSLDPTDRANSSEEDRTIARVVVRKRRGNVRPELSTPGNLIQEFSSRAFARLGGDPAKTGPWVPAPASATKRVTRHLEKQYGIAVSRMSRLDSGFKVERRDGPSWVARWFPPARPRAVVEGDADVLRFLEENDFPAERLAHPEPISDLDGFTILVTEFVEGPQVHHPSGAQMYRLGERLGWVFRSVGGKVSVSKRIAKRAPAIVRTQPADFLRLITQDLDWDTAIGNGRVEVEGDPDQVARVFANGT